MRVDDPEDGEGSHSVEYDESLILSLRFFNLEKFAEIVHEREGLEILAPGGSAIFLLEVIRTYLFSPTHEELLLVFDDLVL